MKKTILILIVMMVPCILHALTSSIKYTYNDINQLTKVEYKDGTVMEYSYDDSGNRIVKDIVIEPVLQGFDKTYYLNAKLTAMQASDPNWVGKDIEDLESFGTRYLYAENHREVSLWIKQKFINFGFENTMIDSFPKYASGSETWHYNIIATIEGIVNPNQYYIIGGHWDSYSEVSPIDSAPGADDNASGTAAVTDYNFSSTTITIVAGNLTGTGFGRPGSVIYALRLLGSSSATSGY